MINKSKILVLHNSFSGKGKGKKMANTIGKVLSIKNLEFANFENEWPSNLDIYSEVWLIGGDGTLNYFLNKYHEINTPIALFPGGTGNDFHWKLYGNITTENQIEKVLIGNSKKVDIGICNGERFINTIGLGFDGEVLKEMKTVRFFGGHMGYLLIVVKKIFSYSEKMYDVALNGNQFKIKCLLFLVSNSSRTGGGFMVSPEAKIDDGLLNVIYSNPLSILKRLILLSKVEHGKHLNDKNISHFLCNEINITCYEEIFYQLDGELRKGKQFEVKILKSYLKFKV